MVSPAFPPLSTSSHYHFSKVLSSLLPVCRHGGPLASEVFDDDEGAREGQGEHLEEEEEGLYPQGSQWVAEQQEEKAHEASPVAAITEKVLLSSLPFFFFPQSFLPHLN